MKRRYFLPLCLALSLCACAFAQDKATLDLLVKKGVITQEEADTVGKQSVLIVQPKEKSVKRLTISGLLQTQFAYVAAEAPTGNPLSVQEFMVRRAFLGVAADLGGGLRADLEMDFTAGQGSTTQTGKGTRQLFNKVLISKEWEDIGKLTLGYRKVNFAQEEVTSGSKLKTIERSIATRFFTEALMFDDFGPLAFGNRHVGAFWEGKVPRVKGLTYRAAVANGQQSVTGFNMGGNQMSYWGALEYKGKSGALEYTAGVNTGYSQNANTFTYGAPANDVFGVNPYANLKWGRAEAMFDFLWANVQNGAGSGNDAQPFGLNIIPSYRLNGEWEIAGRFSYISGNGRAITPNNVFPNSPFTSLSFGNAYSVYGGLNWYITGDALKVMLGYEWVHFYGGSISDTLDEHALRTQLQLLF